jgi:ribosome biogenesis GTPase
MSKQDTLEGTVIKSTGSWYDVEAADGVIYKSRIKGRFRLDGLKVTNPIAVGDKVVVKVSDYEDAGTIVEIKPRNNYVVRSSPRKRHHVHLLASNVDQAMLIVTMVEPKLKQGFIDRFLLMTEPYDIPAIIVFNKADLHDQQAAATYQELHSLYVDIGYQVVLVSATEDQGLAELKDILTDKITLIVGQSGVGKSTIVNAIEPNLDLRTGDISDYSGKGQHTTTFAEMYHLSFGGSIIDTPGIKTLAFNHLEVMDVAHNFKEFFRLSDDCRFNNCTHRNEPGCAVKEAIESGDISPLRYINYNLLVDEVEDQNYWERHKG